MEEMVRNCILGCGYMNTFVYVLLYKLLREQSGLLNTPSVMLRSSCSQWIFTSGFVRSRYQSCNELWAADINMKYAPKRIPLGSGVCWGRNRHP